VRVEDNLKEKLIKAQRMYYLSQKLGGMVPEYEREFSKYILNYYTKLAKEMDLKLTTEELYHRLLK